MSTKKSIGTLLACALALGVSGVASATIVNVGGVTWDTGSRFNLTIQALSLRESPVSNVGDVLTGFGEIGSINGNKDFCPGCDLTFTYSYTVQSINGNQVVFGTGTDGTTYPAGTFQFYVSTPGSFDPAVPTSASLGTEWLTLTAHTSKNVAFTDDVGQLFSSVNGTVSHPTANSGGAGLVDATGGPAMDYLNIYKVSDGMGGFANLSLNSEFQFKPAKGCSGTSSDPSNLCFYPISGTGSLVNAVPEPGALGMLGLGVGVLGFFFWRRRKEADDRA